MATFLSNAKGQTADSLFSSEQGHSTTEECGKISSSLSAREWQAWWLQFWVQNNNNNMASETSDPVPPKCH